MADPAVARETFFSLRETIARMEGRMEKMCVPTPASSAPASPARLGPTRLGPAQATPEQTGGPDTAEAKAFQPLDIADIDAALGGGLPRAGMAEIRAAEMRNAGSATGLALAFCAFLSRNGGLARDGEPDLPAHIFWVGERNVCREAGEPLGEGLEDYGIAREHLIYAAPRKLEDALWLVEAALKSRAFRAVILEIAGNPSRFGLSESRRLSLKARHAGSLLLLLRQGGGEEAGSTLFRLQAGPAPSGLHVMPDGTALRGTIGAAVFSITLEKGPKSASSAFSTTSLLEWNAHERLFRSPPSVPPFVRRQPGAAHPVTGFSLPADGQDRPAAMGAVMAFHRAS